MNPGLHFAASSLRRVVELGRKPIPQPLFPPFSLFIIYDCDYSSLPVFLKRYVRDLRLYRPS